MTFIHSVVKEILFRTHVYHFTGNWDYLRYGPNPVENQPGKVIFDPERATNYLFDMLNDSAGYEWLHANVADEASRQWILELLTYRVLGYAHVKLPLNTPEFWNEYQTIDSRYLVESNVAKSSNFSLHRYRAEVHGHTLDLIGHPLSVLMMRLGQYYFDRDGVKIGPQPGDIVIDGGGCWGEAAIDFANVVGPAGRVYSFEFVPNNLAIYRNNLAMNPDAASRITIVERALGKSSGELVKYDDVGPATVVGHPNASMQVSTQSIDDLVREQNLPRVDFIKLDIEGAERDTLAGAMHTIRTFRPRMALCLYHRPSDLFAIPQIVRQIESRYELRIDHYTIYDQETVLYARVV